MTAISARSAWLAHLRCCTRCPTDLCDRGEELAAAVRATMAPGETWQSVYRPTADQLPGQLTFEFGQDAP